MDYKIVPLPAETTAPVKQTGTDPIFGYEYDVMRSIAGPDGYGSCRECLQKFSEGESRLIFLYNPFGAQLGDYTGPVFIHEEPCVSMPASTSFPDALRDLPMLMRGYDSDGHFVNEMLDSNFAVEQTLQTLFQNDSVSEIHIRNTEARCFIAKAIRKN